MEPTTGRGEPSSSFTGGLVRDDLANTLSRLARSLQDEPTEQDTLDAVVASAVGTVPGAQYAGAMIVEHRRHIHTRAASADLVRKVDQVQYETGQGPCLSAIYTERTIRLSDMATDTRWPEFARRTIALGIRSMLSLQLFVRDDNLGALNLYSRDTDAFTDESEHVGLLFAAHAAIALSDAQQREQLSHAVAVRDLIGQAKGILMERHKLTAEQAFTVLVRASQTVNTKLIDIARHLVETGELSTRQPR